jgi:carbonic anhydrase
MASGRAQAQEAKPAEKHEWDYGKEHGPARWGDLKPEFATCRVGRYQSPIDIQKAEKADLPPIQFDYHPSPLRIVDNGHTVMVTYGPGSSIRVGDRQYALKQFHFHRPSEEKIHGQSYEMSLHLVHADSSGKLAVVGVLLERGRENALVRQLWSHVPKEKEKEALEEKVQINAADLLPADHGYYTFEGSLTTPPCSENVTWLVLKQPLPVSAGEIAEFSKLYSDDARPTQPLNDRLVKETR